MGARSPVTARTTSDHGFQGGIAPQFVNIVLIFMPKGDLVDLPAKQVEERMIDFARLSPVVKTARVGGDGPCCEAGYDFQIENVSKPSCL